jgi:hypothetical protein
MYVRYLLAALLLVCGSSFVRADCSDVLKDGARHFRDIRNKVIFRQWVIATYNHDVDKTNRQKTGIMSELLGSSFSQEDVESLKTKTSGAFNYKTLSENDYSLLLALGDPDVLSDWDVCMDTRDGVSAWFEPESPKTALLVVDYWPHRSDVRGRSTSINNDPLAGKEGLKADEDHCLMKDKRVSEDEECVVSLEFASPATEITVVVETDHGEAKAYLPPRMKITAERRTWHSDHFPGGTATIRHQDRTSVSEEKCLSPPDGWVFNTTSFTDVSKRSGYSVRCRGEFRRKEPEKMCFVGRFFETEADTGNFCMISVDAEIMKWDVVEASTLND